MKTSARTRVPVSVPVGYLDCRIADVCVLILSYCTLCTFSNMRIITVQNWWSAATFDCLHVSSSTLRLPRVGPGYPFFFLFPLSIHFFIFCSFFTFPFLSLAFMFLSTPALSTRRAPLRFQAESHRKRPNLGLVCCA